MREIACDDVVSGDNYTLWNADCVEVLAALPDNSVDFSVFSPPFAALYVYSESSRDMGNVADNEEFQAAYAFVARELFRVTKPGRLVSIHVKDLVFYSNSSDKGDRGLTDFTGACIRTHRCAGWTTHSKTTVRRCPVREMTKSKPDGLLYKNFRTDAGRVRQGLPEYIVTFRKWVDDMEGGTPIAHVPGLWPEWAGEGRQFVSRRVESHEGLPDYMSLSDAEMKRDPRYFEALDVWQRWADPVWMDDDETDVLNVKAARDPNAERHLCPMPLGLIERCIRLWSNRGDVVLSPFAGIGSEGVKAIECGRRFLGVELNPTYFHQAGRNLGEAEAEAGDLFGPNDAQAAANADPLPVELEAAE